MTYRGEVSGNAVIVVEFPAFAACALAGIGDLPDTILDRCVIIAMKRRAPHERVDPYRERLVRPHADALRERLASWAEFNLDELRDAWPEMPSGIVDRAADVWEALIAIAACAGVAGQRWRASQQSSSTAHEPSAIRVSACNCLPTVGASSMRLPSTDSRPRRLSRLSLSSRNHHGATFAASLSTFEDSHVDSDATTSAQTHTASRTVRGVAPARGLP